MTRTSRATQRTNTAVYGRLPCRAVYTLRAKSRNGPPTSRAADGPPHAGYIQTPSPPILHPRLRGLAPPSTTPRHLSLSHTHAGCSIYASLSLQGNTHRSIRRSPQRTARSRPSPRLARRPSPPRPLPRDRPPPRVGGPPSLLARAPRTPVGGMRAPVSARRRQPTVTYTKCS